MTLRERLAGFEKSPLATWVDSHEAVRLLWANRAAIALWNGGSLDELRARKFEMSESTRRQRHEWMKALREGSIEYFKVDWTLYPKGVPVLLTMYGTHLELDDGSYGFLYQAIPKEIPLAPEIARNAEAIRHISAAVTMLSLDGTELDRNPAAIEAFGLVAPISTWFDDKQLSQEIIARANAGEVYRGEASSTRDGESRIYAIDARKISDPVTGEDAVLIHLLDETAFARVEEQEQRWRALLDSAPELIMIVDRRHHVEFANRGFTGNLSDAAALVGQRVEELFRVDSRTRMSATIERVFELGISGACEAHSGERIGSRQHDVRFAPIDTGGAVQRLILSSSDVTEQRELEHQLRHSEKMQAVGTLAGSIAHDFNNLLTIMVGACELVELDIEPDHPGRELIDDIAAAGHRAQRLTQQLLSFSRKQTPRPELLDLNGLVGDMNRLLERAIGDGVTLTLALDDRPCWIHADPGQIDQILMNLAINARDAMPDGGTLTIATRWCESPTLGVILEVSDTGVGMSETLQARVFEPFFTTKPAGKGTGLGLSTVVRLIAQTGGHLELDSELGRGTRFEIRLPRVDCAVQQTQ